MIQRGDRKSIVADARPTGLARMAATTTDLMLREIMTINLQTNDMGKVIEADRAHVWHHLSQHKVYETVDPRVFIEGRGMKLWDAKGNEYLDAVFCLKKPSTSAIAGNRSRTPCATSWSS